MTDAAGTRSVLLVESEEASRNRASTVLGRAGLGVAAVGDGKRGLQEFFERRPDLVIIETSVPKIDGWTMLARIRELSQTPVMLLSSRGGELDKVRGLRAGADDYVVKPFGSQELLARAEALLRRGSHSTDQVRSSAIRDELVEIDFARHAVTVCGAAVELTPTEFRLLSAFARNPHQVLDARRLLELAWGDHLAGSADQVKLYVSYLRRKLRGAAGVEPISTVRGFGYRYDPN